MVKVFIPDTETVKFSPEAAYQEVGFCAEHLYTLYSWGPDVNGLGGFSLGQG